MRYLAVAFGLLALVRVAGAEQEWQAQPFEQVRAPEDFEEPLRQDLEDLISKDKVYSLGYHYDHFGVWTEDYDDQWERFLKSWKVDIIPQAWYARLRGPVTFNDGVVVDLTTTFGLEEELPTPALRAKVWYKNLYVGLDWYSVRFSGSTHLQEQVQLPDGTIIRVDEQLDTDLGIDDLRIVVGGTAWKSKQDKWFLDVFLGVNVFRFDLEFRVPDQDASFKAQAWLPVPVIGAKFGGHLGQFIWEVEASGLGLSYKIFGAEFLDLRGSVGWRFGRGVAVRAGYRYTDIAASVTELKVEFELSGPFLEAVITF